MPERLWQNLGTPFFVWLLPRKFTKPCGIRPTAAAWGASLMPESRKNEIPHKCNFTKTVGKCFWLLIYFSSPWIYLSQKRNEILCHLRLNRSWTAAWSARKAVLSTSSQGLSETPSRQFYWVANMLRTHKALVFWNRVLLCYSELSLFKIMFLLCFSELVFGCFSGFCLRSWCMTSETMLWQWWLQFTTPVL